MALGSCEDSTWAAGTGGSQEVSLTFCMDKKNCLGGTVWGLLHAVPRFDGEVPREEGEPWTSSGGGREGV